MNEFTEFDIYRYIEFIIFISDFLPAKKQKKINKLESNVDQNLIEIIFILISCFENKNLHSVLGQKRSKGVKNLFGKAY